MKKLLWVLLVSSGAWAAEPAIPDILNANWGRVEGAYASDGKACFLEIRSQGTPDFEGPGNLPSPGSPTSLLVNFSWRDADGAEAVTELHYFLSGENVSWQHDTMTRSLLFAYLSLNMEFVFDYDEASLKITHMQSGISAREACVLK